MAHKLNEFVPSPFRCGAPILPRKIFLIYQRKFLEASATGAEPEICQQLSGTKPGQEIVKNECDGVEREN